MKNMDYKTFCDWMFEGKEIVFKYKNKIYNYELSEGKINLYQLFDNKDGLEIYSCDYNKATLYEKVKNMIELPLFDGKKIYEIEQEICVISNS